MKFMETEDWKDDEQYPAILAVCKDERLRRKLTRQMRRILNDTWDDDIVLATTTTNRLQQASKPTDKIWGMVDYEGNVELLSLEDLLQPEDDE